MRADLGLPKSMPASIPADVRAKLEAHQKWLQKLPGGARAILARSTFSGVSWPDVNLSGADLDSTTWLEADLSGANFAGASLNYADFRRAALNRAEFTGCHADSAQFNQAWMLGAILPELKLLNGALGGIHAAGSRWPGASLTGCDFALSDLEKSSFQQARLFRCNFSGACLTAANLYHVRAQMVRFFGLQGLGAAFHAAVLTDCDFAQANLAGARFSQADLSRSQFTSAQLRESDFRGARLSGASFANAEFAGARLGGANLMAADFRHANLNGARELTSEQLSKARTDDTTILPNGSRGPFVKRSGAERPGAY